MSSNKASGYSLTEADIPTVLGMVARDDRAHDIAAWFGVNQGRIAEAQAGKWGLPPAASPESLPPKGAPGVKGRRLFEAVAKAIKHFEEKGLDRGPEVHDMLEQAIADYNKHEA